MNNAPNMYADIIPFYGAAGFLLGMSIDDFIHNVQYIKATDEIVANWYSNDNSYRDDSIWYIKDEFIRDFFDQNRYERIVNCYWNKDILLTFSGEKCTLNSIVLCGNYRGKLLGNVSIGDNLNIIHKIYDFYFYGDCNYLMYKDKDDEVIGAEIMTNYLSEYSELILDQIIVAIRIYNE